jgi:hypothetical protein
LTNDEFRQPTAQQLLMGCLGEATIENNGIFRVPVNQGQVIIALIKTPRAINSYKLIGQ